MALIELKPIIGANHVGASQHFRYRGRQLAEGSTLATNESSEAQVNDLLDAMPFYPPLSRL